MCNPSIVNKRLKLDHALAAARWFQGGEALAEVRREAFARVLFSKQAARCEAEWPEWTSLAQTTIAQSGARRRGAMQYLMAAVSGDASDRDAQALWLKAWTLESSATSALRAAKIEAGSESAPAAIVRTGPHVRLIHSVNCSERSVLLINDIGKLLRLKANDSDVKHIVALAQI